MKNKSSSFQKKNKNKSSGQTYNVIGSSNLLKFFDLLSKLHDWHSICQHSDSTHKLFCLVQKTIPLHSTRVSSFSIFYFYFYSYSYFFCINGLSGTTKNFPKKVFQQVKGKNPEQSTTYFPSPHRGKEWCLFS